VITYEGDLRRSKALDRDADSTKLLARAASQIIRVGCGSDIVQGTSDRENLSIGDRLGLRFFGGPKVSIDIGLSPTHTRT
jgi:hypothetical protein